MTAAGVGVGVSLHVEERARGQVGPAAASPSASSLLRAAWAERPLADLAS